MRRIYLDNAASTPVDPKVLEAMLPYYSEKFGNPGSVHSFGQEAIGAIDKAREEIANAIHAGFRQIIFTGSATEANNLAIRGTLITARNGKAAILKPRLIISAIEHESILETARAGEKMGVEVIYIPVDRSGMIDEKKIKENLNESTVLVSIIYGNNEIGSIQPIRKIAETIRSFRGKNIFPLFHTDAAQALQFLNCDVESIGVDLMTFSAHKIYGPKGIGALYVRDLTTLAAVTEGGGQEFGLRSGTENVPSIVGFAKALELVQESRSMESVHIGGLRDELWEEIKKITPSAEINGPISGQEKLPHILNVYFPSHAAQDLLTKFDLKGLAASSGSACRSRAIEPSYVIKALGYEKERAASSIRFSLGKSTTKEDIFQAVSIIRETFSR